MPKCSVPQCSTTEGGHRFPRNEARRKEWLTAIGRKNLRPSIHAVVCKKHFIPDDYMLPKDSVYPNPSPRLKKDAVPSIFPWNSKPIKANIDHVQKAIRRQRKKEQEMEIERQKEKIEREINIAKSQENEKLNMIEAMDFVQVEMELPV